MKLLNVLLLLGMALVTAPAAAHTLIYDDGGLQLVYTTHDHDGGYVRYTGRDQHYLPSYYPSYQHQYTHDHHYRGHSHYRGCGHDDRQQDYRSHRRGRRH